MATYALARFTSPNAGVAVNQAVTDQYIAAAYGLALKNLDVNALGIAITNTLTSAGIIDASAASDTAGLKVPTKAGAVPTADGFIAVDSTGHVLVFGSNGATIKALGNAIANTLTAAGALDASAASVTAGLKLPSGAGANPTTAGILSHDTTSKRPVYGDGTNTIPLGPTEIRFTPRSAGLAQNATNYMLMGDHGGSSALYGLLVVTPCIFTKLYVQSFSAPGAGQSYVMTLYKNNSATTLTATLSGAAATTANDTAHTVTCAAGDYLSIQVVSSATATNNQFISATVAQ